MDEGTATVILIAFVALAVFLALAALAFVAVVLIDAFSLAQSSRQPAQRRSIVNLFRKHPKHRPTERERIAVFDAVIAKALRGDVAAAKDRPVVVPFARVDDAFNLERDLQGRPRDIKPIPTRRVKAEFRFRRRQPLDLQLKDERVSGDGLDAGTAAPASSWRRDDEPATGDEMLQSGSGQSNRHDAKG